VPSTTAVVTSCTQRKSVPRCVDFAQLPQFPNVTGLAQAWQRLLRTVSPAGAAQSVYQGRSIADAATAASHLGCPWYVVSGGLGLVRSEEPVPAYECTAAGGSELDGRLKRLGVATSDWWTAITTREPQPLTRLISRRPVLLALPGSYLRMVRDDLAHLSATKADQLRIFTSSRGARFVPEHLAHCVMPYDDRLEAVPNYAGTQSDFAQRALRHFVEALDAASLTLEEARAAVLRALARRPRRPRSIGERRSDDEIRSVLTAQWTRHAGSSTRLLRYLRDEAGIACEQKRFRRIWQSLSAELRA